MRRSRPDTQIHIATARADIRIGPAMRLADAERHAAPTEAGTIARLGWRLRAGATLH